MEQPIQQAVSGSQSPTRSTSGAISEGAKTTQYHSLYFYNHLKEDDKYPVFLDGNHPLTTIENTKAPNGTIILIKDSFSHCFAPFLAENYRKVILVDMLKNNIKKI